MIGEDAFCPKTGAPLSEKPEYDEQDHSRRAALPDEFTAELQLPGELTNGAVTSSKAALFNQFRRCHQRHADASDVLYRKAALDLRRLKSTAEGRADWDVHVWYALQRRLDERRFGVEWMHAHAELRCSHCHGRLKYKLYGNGDVYALCGTNCTDDKADQLGTIREIIAALYSRSFADSVNAGTLLQFDA